MNTSLRRIIGIVGLLAAVAFVIITSSRPDRERPGALPSAENSTTPGPTPTTVSSDQQAPSQPVDKTRSGSAPKPPPAVASDVPTQTSPAAPVEASTVARPPMPASPGTAPVSAGPSPAPATDADFAALANDLEHVRLIIREYRDVVGENPMGTNAEIMQAVLGDNLKQAKIGLPEGQRLNGKGELVDRWGTPYFFHQVSKNEMQVRSAGPDQVMWTGDDREM